MQSTSMRLDTVCLADPVKWLGPVDPGYRERAGRASAVRQSAQTIATESAWA